MRFIKRYKYLITFIIVLTITIIIIIYKDKLNKNSNDNIVVENDIEQKEDIKLDNIYVDIKGAVVNPGVYKVEDNTIVDEIITLAGGLTEQADTSLTNLAKVVENGDLIIIYTKEEIENSNLKESVIKIVDKECVCPNIQNDGCINNEITENITNKEKQTDIININSATLEQLMTLDGIGESKAKAIIEYRETNGPFSKIEDITNVSGIGENVYQKIKDRLTV